MRKYRLLNENYVKSAFIFCHFILREAQTTIHAMHDRSLLRDIVKLSRDESNAQGRSISRTNVTSEFTDFTNEFTHRSMHRRYVVAPRLVTTAIDHHALVRAHIRESIGENAISAESRALINAARRFHSRNSPFQRHSVRLGFRWHARFYASRTL